MVDDRARPAHRSRRIRLPGSDLCGRRHLRLPPLSQPQRHRVPDRRPRRRGHDQQRAQADRRSGTTRRDPSRRIVRLLVPVRTLRRGSRRLVRAGVGHRTLLVAPRRATLAAVAAVITLAVAASRALLGVHWLTDVLAGMIVGWSWFLLAALVFGGRIL